MRYQPVPLIKQPNRPSTVIISPPTVFTQFACTWILIDFPGVCVCVGGWAILTLWLPEKSLLPFANVQHPLFFEFRRGLCGQRDQLLFIETHPDVRLLATNLCWNKRKHPDNFSKIVVLTWWALHCFVSGAVGRF